MVCNSAFSMILLLFEWQLLHLFMSYLLRLLPFVQQLLPLTPTADFQRLTVCMYIATNERWVKGYQLKDRAVNQWKLTNT